MRRVELRFVAGEGRTVVEVLQPPSGGRASLEAPDGGEPGMAAAARPGFWRGSAPEREEAVRVAGEGLYRALFAGPLAGARPDPRWEEDTTLVLRFAPGTTDAARLPWELLRDERGELLALARHLQLVRLLEVPNADHPPPLPVGPLRVMVVLLRSGAGDLHIDAEVAAMRAALGAAARVSVLDDPDLDGLRGALARGDPHVVHLAGHARLDGARGGVVTVGGREIDGATLATQLTEARSLRMVVLNACRSADLQANPSPLPTLAEALVASGVPAVLGMWATLTDEAAVAFAADFYRTLALGASVERAVASGRRAVHARPGDARMDWTLPVLFASAAGITLVAPAPPPVSRRAWVVGAASLGVLAAAAAARRWSRSPLGEPAPASPPDTSPLAPAGLRVVGDAVLLYRPSPGERAPATDGVSPWVRALAVHVDAPPRALAVTPRTTRDLEALVYEARTGPAVERYLLDRARGGEVVPVEHRAKLGVKELSFTEAGLGRPLALIAVPDSDWVERQFNRRLLLGDDPALAELARAARAEIFASWPAVERFVFSAPAVLYVETALLLRDGAAVVLHKRSEQGSTLARVGRPLTVGPERSVALATVGEDGAVDWIALAMDALREELGLDAAAVASLTWEGVALETHLNVALLCTARLALDTAAFTAHFAEHGGAWDGARTLPIDTLLAELLSARPPTGAHTTAALRLTLAHEG